MTTFSKLVRELFEDDNIETVDNDIAITFLKLGFVLGRFVPSLKHYEAAGIIFTFTENPSCRKFKQRILAPYELGTKRP